MSKSILKAEIRELPVFKKVKISSPEEWAKLFNFKNIEANIENFPNYKINDCYLKKEKNEYWVYPVSTRQFNTDHSKFIGLDIEKISKLIALEKVMFKNLKEAVFYIFLDLVSEIGSDSGVLDLEKYGFKNQSKFAKSKLLETNKNSIFIEKMGKNSTSSKQLSNNVVEAFQKSGLLSLELPIDYDKRKVLNFFKKCELIYQKIGFPKNRRNFRIRFKKLGTYSDNGYYSFETNTIILDPRYTDVFLHELGHLIYDNKVKIKKKIKADSSEEFARIIS